MIALATKMIALATKMVAGAIRPKDPFVRLPGHQYARNYPDPITGDPLQVYPPKVPSDFESEDDFWKHKDAVSRWNNSLPPPRPKPPGDKFAPRTTPHLPKSASRFNWWCGEVRAAADESK